MSMPELSNLHQKITIQPLTEKYIGSVVHLHQSVLGETLNSRLGAKHLEHLYRVMLQSPDCFIGIALSDSNLAGFISGALNLNAIKPVLLKTMPPSGWLNIALRFLRHPDLLVEWMHGNQVGQPIFLQGKRVDSILTTIGVDQNFQGFGIGKKLVHELEQYFKAHGVTAYRLDTLTTNDQARRFYESQGFAPNEIRAGSILYLKELS